MTKMDASVAQVAAVVKKDHRVGCWMTEEKTRIPKTNVQKILHDNLKKRKICPTFAPHGLTAEQCYQRVAHTCKVLKTVKNDLEF